MEQPIKKMRSVAFAFLVSLTAVSYAVAQSVESPTPTIRNDNNCESNKALWDLIDIEAGNDSPIIIIARLGSGEVSRRFNHRRLHNIRTYLHYIREIPEGRIITAQGERVAGRGRVEVYVGGRLFIVFTVGRNEDLAGGACEETRSLMYYPMQRR